MATSDLANELAKESFRFDSPGSEKQASGEPASGQCWLTRALFWVAHQQPAPHRLPSATTPCPQVSEVVLTQLEDASGDISGLAVKWCAVAGLLPLAAAMACCCLLPLVLLSRLLPPPADSPSPCPPSLPSNQRRAAWASW